MTWNVFLNESSSILSLYLALIVDALTHTIMVILGPLIVQSFSPDLSWASIGFYSGYLTGITYLGNGVSFSTWEKLTGKWGLKMTILIGLVVVAVGFLSLSYCESYISALMIQLLVGVFNGILPAARLSIANVSSLQPQTVLNHAWNIGLILGPALSSLMLFYCQRDSDHTRFVANEGVQYAFFVSGIIAIAAAAFVYFKLEDIDTRNRRSYVHLKTSDGDYDQGKMTRASKTDSNNDQVLNEWLIRKKNNLSYVMRNAKCNFRRIRSIIPQSLQLSHNGKSLIWCQSIDEIRFEQLTDLHVHDIIDHHYFLMDYSANHSSELVVVMDLTGISLKDTTGYPTFLLEQHLHFFQHEYKNALNRLVLLNVPVWFSYIWKSISVHLSPLTLKKIQFLNKIQTQPAVQELFGPHVRSLKDLDIYSSPPEKAIALLLAEIDDDSDEEAFFDCSEYGLEDEETQRLEEDNISLFKQVAESPRTVEIHLLSGNTSPRAHRSQSAASNASVSMSDKKSRLALFIFCSWAFAQTSFDEVYPLWSFIQASKGDRSLSPGFIGGTLAAVASTVLGVQVYGLRNVKDLSSDCPLPTFYMSTAAQIPFFLAFGFLRYLGDSWVTWVIIVLSLLAKHHLYNIGFKAILVFLDNVMGLQDQPKLQTLAMSLELLSCGIGCIFSSTLLAIGANSGFYFPFDDSLPFNFASLFLAIQLVAVFSIKALMSQHPEEMV